MAINKLPSELQNIIDDKTLDRVLQESLKAELGFRAAADREDFPNKIGESVTKTRNGLRAAVTTPITAAPSSDLTSGVTPSTAGNEQYTLSVNMYGDSAETNLVTEGVAIASKFLTDAGQLFEQAQRSVDVLARDALFNSYMGGNTRVKTTLGANGPAVAVDDVRGFAVGDVVAVGSTDYTVQSIAVDGSNTSTVFGGKSGTITFTGNVTVANATAGNKVVGAKAPLVVRPNARLTSAALQAGDKLNTDMLLQSVGTMRANNVPTINGFYNLYIDPIHATALLGDTKFLQAFTGGYGSGEFKNGAVSTIYGLRLVSTNMNPVSTESAGLVRRAMVVGKGALVEGVYTNNGYKNADRQADPDLIRVVDDIAHIVRDPLDAFQQWVTQSWVYIGGFAVPTDKGSNNGVLPTATGSALKRGIILESL